MAPEWSAPSRPGGFSGASDGGQYGGTYGAPTPSAEQPYRAAPRESGPYEPYDPSESGGYRGGGRGGGGSGGYESGRPRRKRGRSAVILPLAGAAVLAVLAGVSVYAFASSSGGCTGSDALNLKVAVAPGIAPAVNSAVSDFNGSKQKVGGKCVHAVVSNADPAAVTTLLSGQGVSGGQNVTPDVWIPDSSMWADLVLASDKGRTAVKLTKTSVAQSPLVVAMPKALVVALAKSGAISTPSWDNLLSAAGGTAGGATTKNTLIPADKIKLKVPDPTRNGSGMTALLLTNALLASDPNRQAIFAGMVRTVQRSTTPTVDSLFTSFGQDARGRFPVALAPEQAVWKHNQGNPASPAVAIYPAEGTLNLDYPFTVTTADSGRAQAAALLEKALGSASTQQHVKQLGFRTGDGTAPDSFGDATGTSQRKPRPLPAPDARTVAGIMQAWSKLSLSIRMLSVVDVSNTMAAKIPGTNENRLQAIQQIAAGGLAMMGDDSDLGQWIFSSHMDGDKPYKILVPVGPLGERTGSVTRRDLIQNGIAKIRVRVGSNTALYETVLSAYKYMKTNYQPDKINSVVIFTNGTDRLPGGLSIQYTVSQLKKMYDPAKPVQLILIGFGSTADRTELEKLTSATEGGAYVAKTPEEIQKIFLEAISKRICNPDCGSAAG